MTTSRAGWSRGASPEAASAEAAVEEPVGGRGRARRDPDYEELFRASYSDTVRHLVRGGVEPETAADCAQEAYVRAYARWWRIRRYQDPAAWVRRVATNVAIDAFRKRGRQRAALPLLLAGAARSSPPPGEPSELEGLSELPDQQRRVIELCYGEDLSAEQAAEQMGISAGAVRFHLSRARARLRPAIDAQRAAEEGA